jgi:hypothetical protein
MVSLTAVLGLLVVAVNAAPIIAKRDDNAASCPGTLRGPSGNAYFGKDSFYLFSHQQPCVLLILCSFFSHELTFICSLLTHCIVFSLSPTLYLFDSYLYL